MKTLKTIAVFIGLKIAELAGVIVIGWLLLNLSKFSVMFWSWLLGVEPNYDIYSRFFSLFTSLVIIAIGLAVIVAIACLAWPLIAINWDWATKITNRKN